MIIYNLISLLSLFRLSYYKEEHYCHTTLDLLYMNLISSNIIILTCININYFVKIFLNNIVMLYGIYYNIYILIIYFN